MPTTLLIITAIISFSPLLTYYSRFLREDMIISAMMVMLFYGATSAPLKWRAIITIPFSVLLFTLKENAYMTLGLILFYLLVDLIYSKSDAYFFKIIRYIKEFKLSVLLTTIASGFLYIYLYTAAFKNPSGLLDGLYKKSLTYWFHQHQIERIKGPFSYHFLNLSWHEQIFGLLFLALLVHFFYKNFRKKQLLVVTSYLLLVVTLSYSSLAERLIQSSLGLFFKLKIPLDLTWLLILISLTLFIPFYYLFKKERLLAFASYFFFSTLLAYSYVGEKVPWLSLYPLIAGVIYIAVYLEEKFPISFTQKTLFVSLFSLCFMIRINLISNFAQAGSSTEFLSQVHTTKIFEETMKNIKRESLYGITKTLPSLLSLGESHWPTSYYFYGSDKFHFLEDRPIKSFEFVLSDQNDPRVSDELMATHERRVLPLRAWWDPDYKMMGIKQYLTYAALHRPWSPAGEQLVDFWVKR